MPFYLRKEPPAPSSTPKFHPPPGARSRDVVAYADPEATQALKRWKWSDPARPNSKTRYVMLGEMERYVVWLPELSAG